MEDDEPIGVPEALSESGQLRSHFPDEALAYFPSWRIIMAQQKDREVSPPYLLPSIISNPTSEMMPIICMKQVSID